LTPDADWKAFASALRSLLQRVLAGETEYRELQEFVDQVITRDELPEDLPRDLGRRIHNLQTDLELLSVAQDKAAENYRRLTNEEITTVLRKYEDLIRAEDV
jgi:hypothetical protein